MLDVTRNSTVSLAENQQYQKAILPAVSRTFALTIPVLPDRLALVVTNAYLLCRIADTIEDDPGLDFARKQAHLQRFLATVNGDEAAESFAAALTPLLAPATPPDELELMRNIHRVVGVTHAFTAAERRILQRCVAVMCLDMPKFQRNSSPDGLRDLPELDAYCYAVAGVVGEMLVDLFCIRCPELAESRPELRTLAVSFGQGLQMTNILKDIWSDHQRGVCWLPRTVFAGGDLALRDLSENHRSEAFQQGLYQLLAIAHGHLKNALEFTCRLPAQETGMRRFCLWALGMAVLTLRKIQRNPLFTAAEQVKISRRAVRATIFVTNRLGASNRGLRWLFDQATRGLPVVDEPASRARRRCS